MRITIKIEGNLHEKMSVLAKKNKRTIFEEYNEAVSKHVANEIQDEMIRDSKLEKIFDEKLGKIDKHLASMLGRATMDVNIIMSGLIHEWAEKHDMKASELYESLRESAGKFYKRGSI